MAVAVAATDSLVNSYEQEIKQKFSVMDSIKNELDRGRQRLKVLQKEEGGYLEQLEQIEQNISASRTYLELLELRIDTVGSLIALMEDSLAEAQKKLLERQSIMKKRIRQAYMTGSPHPLFWFWPQKVRWSFWTGYDISKSLTGPIRNWSGILMTTAKISISGKVKESRTGYDWSSSCQKKKMSSFLCKKKNQCERQCWRRSALRKMLFRR
jgi:hypothetical protein